MRAALCMDTTSQKVHIVDDVEPLPPGPGEVQISIGAAGLCHSDLSAMVGTLETPLPFVPGHEGCGTVVAVGEGVETVSVGDRVVASWIPPCGHCKSCLRGQPNLCVALFYPMLKRPQFRRGDEEVRGFAGVGTWTEQITIPEQAAILVPNDTPYSVGALIGCGVTTGVGAAVNAAKVKVGSSVVIIGCGGVGISAIQGAKVCGASVIVAVDTAPTKLETALSFGATHAVHPDELRNLSKALTGREGFDYAIECIGIGKTFRAAWDATRRGGTTVIVGIGRPEEQLVLDGFELAMSEKTLIGSYYGSADVRTEFHRLLTLWKNGQLDLEKMISASFPLEGINDGITAMKSGSVVRQVVTF